MIESIPRGPSLYIVPLMQMVEPTKTLVRMAFGDEHDIEVRHLEPDESSIQQLRGLKKMIFLDHFFVEQLSGEELLKFRALPGHKSGEEAVYGR